MTFKKQATRIYTVWGL